MRTNTNTLIIPQYPCNGGMDTKFQTEPREVSGYQQWTDILTPTEFTHCIEQINTAPAKPAPITPIPNFIITSSAHLSQATPTFFSELIVLVYIFFVVVYDIADDSTDRYRPCSK